MDELLQVGDSSEWEDNDGSAPEGKDELPDPDLTEQKQSDGLEVPAGMPPLEAEPTTSEYQWCKPYRY